jgi:hypothetical protein
MPSQDPPTDRPQDQSEIDQLNEKLSASIGRCRTILDDCRSRLVANTDVADEDAPLIAQPPAAPEP